MSRIGRRPVPLPEGVTAHLAGDRVTIKGPKGELEQDIITGITVREQDGELLFEREQESRKYRAFHGMVRALVANMVHGVSEGFERRLEIVGVGYKAEVKGRDLVLELGYSQPVVHSIPDAIEITVEKNGVIVVKGIDKQQVGQTAAEIRAYRPPDCYKGKGVRYKGEYVRIKAGKTAT